MLESFFKPNPKALEEVSEEALSRILQSSGSISDIRVDRSLSNCIVFNSKNMDGSVLNDQLVELRSETNQLVADRVRKRFKNSYGMKINESGHFWYPPGGYMKWHTNVRTPGWRLYVSYVEEPGKSFFRYRDPDTGKIVTSWDDGWNFRLFKIDPNKLFWHAVYSNTNRYSLGYRIAEEGRRQYLIDLLKRVWKERPIPLTQGI